MKHHGQADVFIPPTSPLYKGYFGRIFRNLDAFQPPCPENEVDKFFADIANSMVEPAGQNLDNPRIPAAYTYLGQFIDHDITFDPMSSLQRQNDPNQLENFRTPRFDLDCVYGRGPEDAPFLYDNEQPGKLLLGKGAGEGEDDLPRNAQGTAVIGDPRNDENIIVGQTHLALMKFHNHVVDHVRERKPNLSGRAQFQEAQRITRWHYQWVVVQDFVRRLVGDETLDAVLPEKDDFRQAPRLRFYQYRNNAFMPVEFSVAAYRIGHSMVRSNYALNDVLSGFAGNIPLFVKDHTRPTDDLRGGHPLPQIWTIQWELFIETGSNRTQFSRLLDPLLVPELAQLPGPPGLNVLAFRNLKRGHVMGLPSGQAVARAMGVEPLPPAQKDCEDPLWLYILREAGEAGEGHHLGKVGGRIVAEVFVGILAADPLSYMNVQPTWTPELGTDGRFELADLLRFAGVPMTASDLPFPASPRRAVA